MRGGSRALGTIFPTAFTFILPSSADDKTVLSDGVNLGNVLKTTTLEFHELASRKRHRHKQINLGVACLLLVFESPKHSGGEL